MRPLSCLLVFALGCGETQPQPPLPEVVVDDALKAELNTVASARVFFGHQSVGGDLLAGLATLSKEAGVPVAIGEGPVGANKDPLGKMDDFATQLETSKTPYDLVAMKLCYVDFTPSTDVAALLVRYQETIKRVRAARPGVKILHFTSPLTARPTGVKSSLQRALGRTVWEDSANKKRLEFNEALRRAFASEPVFDIATFEAKRPDGKQETFAVDGVNVPMMWAGYTYDGGHLNDGGKRTIGRAFVGALAHALRKEGPCGQ